jgi:transcriptional regulator with XRE-family HTH domain
MIEKYLNIAIAKQNCKNDAELSRLLLISRAALSKWRCSGSVSQESLLRIARLAGVKPEKIFIDYIIKNSRSIGVKNTWLRISKKTLGNNSINYKKIEIPKMGKGKK